MILKNLLRRKVRTLLTLLGISIGVLAIVGLGALADGIENGYSAVLQGGDSDYVLGSKDAADLTLSTVDIAVADQLRDYPEVAEVSGLLQGIVQAANSPYFFVFAYTENSFSLDRYQIIEGESIYTAQQTGPEKPLILGTAARDVFDLGLGDRLTLGNTIFTIVGIYETGDAFESGGAVIRLEDAQALLGKEDQVSIFYIRLTNPGLAARFEERVAENLPNLLLSTGQDMAEQNTFAISMRAMVWTIAGLAILVGGIGMTNTQLMSVLERTREIGVLRAVGWSRWRVLAMILGESLLTSLIGGLVGVVLAWAMLTTLGVLFVAFGATPNLQPGLIIQSLIIVFVLGLAGGAYPAWRAAQMTPIEALRYEGGATGQDSGRLPVGGMVVQNLWRRKARTLLTLTVIGITIGTVLAMQGLLTSVTSVMVDFLGGSAELVVRQKDAADLGYAFLDETIGDRIASLPQVEGVSGHVFTASIDPQLGPLIIQGLEPNSLALRDFRIIEGGYLTKNNQMMLGYKTAEAAGVEIGQRFTIAGESYRVVGIYQASTAWMELGGVITLSAAQGLAGRPGQVTYFSVDLYDPATAAEVAELIEARFPETAANLPTELTTQLPDMQNVNAMSDSLLYMSILIGGVGVMNTMLMAVFERTREIGVLRALGWRRRAILSLILRESLALALLGGVSGAIVGVAMLASLQFIPQYGALLAVDLNLPLFINIFVISALLGILGGLWPALQATRLQPVEALRYE